MPSEPGSLEPVHLPQPAVRLSHWSLQLVLASAGTGALGALAAALVRLGFRGLQWLLTGSSADPPEAALHLAPWRRLLTPILGASVASLVLWLQHRRREASVNAPYTDYVEAVRHEHGLIPLPANLWRTLSAAWSVASGASVGREGSMIQFAAAVASAIARLRRSSSGRPALPLGFLVACGVAGGVTTAYNAPLAGTLFAAEIVLGGLQWAELPLLGLAAAMASLVGGALLGRARLYPLPAVPHLAGRQLVPLLLLTVVLGLAAPVYQWLLGWLRQARRLPAALLLGGAVTGALSVLDPRVWGNGDAGLRASLGIAHPAASVGAPVALARLLLVRLTANLACVWTGTIGGVFTPTLFAGATLGALLSHVLLSAAAPLWALAGMSVFLSAVTHAPLMAGAMAVELTGAWRLLPALLLLNLLATTIARRLSPRALYAIASQSPDHGSSATHPLKR